MIISRTSFAMKLQRTKTDDILYYIGKQMEIVLNKLYPGPTLETCQSKYEQGIKINNKEKINFDKMNAKEIEYKNTHHLTTNNIKKYGK